MILEFPVTAQMKRRLKQAERNQLNSWWRSHEHKFPAYDRKIYDEENAS